MKQRLTYLVTDPAEFSPDQVEVTGNAVQVRKLDAAKEQHLTLGLSELPQEIQQVLKQCHELHIRWASPEAYTGIAPYVSRVAPGLHIFFTPRRGKSADLLCPLLKQLFGGDLKCSSPEETFVSQPILSERFSASASFSYFQVLSKEQWRYFTAYLHDKTCPDDGPPCEYSFGAIETAQSVDLDYDAISHAAILRAYWDPSTALADSWTETAARLQGRLTSSEVGILNNEKPDEPEELKLGGFLSVLGQDTELKATLFSFPARHHALPAAASAVSYNVSFKQPTGLHPALQIDFPSGSPAPPADGCALHTYLTLPSYLFIDKYQFGDQLFLAEHNLRQLHSIAGATDLEAPDWVIPQWGSSALFELAPPSNAKDSDRAWRSTIPMHLRYLSPSNSSDGITEVPVPWPVVFWACKAEEGLKMASSPFDRVNLGYDGLFGPRTMFYHVPPQHGSHMIEILRVPVLKTEHARFMEVGTIVAILLGTAWVCWKLLKVAMQNGSRKEKELGGKKTQ